MASDTDKILAAIAKSSEGINERLDDHEIRIRAMENAITIQGLKVGALVTLIMTICGSVAGIILHKIDALAKWWSSQ